MNYSLLIKFSKEEFIDQLQKEGKLYCNSLRYFRELENDHYIGDPNEGKTDIKQVKCLEIFIGEEKIAFASNAQIYPNNYTIGNVFCLYGFPTSDLDLTTNELQKVSLEIEAERLEDFALIIFDTVEFLRRLEKRLSELNIENQMCPVQYRDFNKHEGKLGPFIKSDKYKSQNEVRVWIPRQSDDKFEVYIGDISDISYKCRKENLENLKMEVLI